MASPLFAFPLLPILRLLTSSWSILVYRKLAIVPNDSFEPKATIVLVTIIFILVP